MSRTILIMAGGTGGHVMPGLAVAGEMRRRRWNVVWLGNPAGMEADLVPRHGIPMRAVRFGGLRGKGLRTRLMLPWNLLRACWQSGLALRAERPAVVLGQPPGSGQLTKGHRRCTPSGPGGGPARTRQKASCDERPARRSRRSQDPRP